MSLPNTPEMKAQKRKEKLQRQKERRANKKVLSTQLFGNAKLLEMVLLRLPLKDLLFAQSVCKTWKNTIDNSADLQKALFFQPAASEVAYFHQSFAFGKVPIPHPLSAGNFFYVVPSHDTAFKVVKGFELGRRKAAPPLSNSRSDAQTKQWRDKLRRIATRTPVFLNPLLTSKIKWFRELFSDTRQVPRFCRIDLEKNTDLHVSARRPEASWRRMLITQPPLATLSAYLDGKSTGKFWSGWSAWNLLGPKHVTQSINMDLLRSQMARSSEYKMRVYGADKFEAWQDGTYLVKIETGRTLLQYEDSDEDTDTDTDNDESHDDLPPLEEGKGKRQAKNKGGRNGGPPPGWVPRMAEFAGGKGLMLF